MKKANVHLTNGEIAELTIFFDERESWLRSVEKQGIHTEDSYFPYHSIVYILFEDPATPKLTQQPQVAEREDNSSVEDLMNSFIMNEVN